MKAKAGSLVVVVYDGFLENGDIFESSENSGPLEFIIGSNTVFPAFEANIIGMSQGEEKTFSLSPEEAMGKSNPDLMQTINRASLPDNDKLQEGMVLGLTIDKGGKKHQVPAIITEITEDNVTVDYNHPLVGKTLTYKVTLESIKAES